MFTMVNLAKAPRGILLLCASVWIVSFLPSQVHGIKVCPVVKPKLTCNITDPNSYQATCDDAASCTKQDEECCPTSCGLKCQRTVPSDKCDQALDLAILLDSSGSIANDDFKKVKDFTKGMVKRLAVSSDKTRIAVISYSTKAKTEFNFETFEGVDLNAVNIERKIDEITHLKKNTFIDKALLLANTSVFVKSNGKGMRDITVAKRVVILMTDGVQTIDIEPYTKAADAAKLLKKKSVTLYCIAVGDDVNFGDLLEISSGDGFVYSAKSFDNLTNVVNSITGNLCPKCKDKVKRDLVFVVENTASSDSDFKKMKFFMNLVVKAFEIGDEGLRVAVVTHGGPATVYLGFRDSANNGITMLINSISKIPFDRSAPTAGSLGEALKAANGLFGSGHTDRGRGVVILGSDRDSNTPEAKAAATALRSKYAHIFGVVLAGTKEALGSIVITDSRVDETLFIPPSVLELDRYGEDLVYGICKTVHPQCCDWGDWGKCNKTCDSGRQSRARRVCTKADPGRTCPTEERVCNIKLCKCKEQAKRDLAFVVENAGTTEVDFNKVKFFMNQVVKAFETVGDEGLRVTVVTHGGPAKSYFGFRSSVNNNIEKLTNRINDIPFDRSAATGSLGEALETANGLFGSGYTDRGRGVVIIGSGRISNTPEAKSAATALRSKYAKILGVVIGDEANEQALSSIITTDSRADTHFEPASALELDRFGQQLVDGVCKTVHPQCCDWGDWDKCSKTCDYGRQSRARRVCSKADPGRTCPTEEQYCAPQKCPERCCEWSSWSACSATCGGGEQVKQQQLCANPPPGKECPKKTRKCKTQKCPMAVVSNRGLYEVV